MSDTLDTLFDLRALEPTETEFCHIRHPSTREPLYSEGRPVGINVYGPDSERFVARQREAANAAIRRGRAARKTAEDLEAEGLDLLVAVTKEPVNLFLDGRMVETKDMRAVYTRFRWLKEQVDLFVSDRANFIKG